MIDELHAALHAANLYSHEAMKGAECAHDWMKSQLWHSAAEIPIAGKELLIKTTLGGYVVGSYSRYTVEWCYIEDLI